MKILMVEDDVQLNTTLKKFLEFEGQNKVTSIYDGNDAIKVIDSDVKFDLYIIDINLPNVDGIELVEYIRNKDIVTPIIIMTASVEIDNFVQAYEKGCNEYIKKPFHPRELEVLMKKVLPQRMRVTDKVSYDFQNQELRINGETIDMRPKEHKLLQILLKNLNHAVSKEDIANYVWEDNDRDNYPIRQLIKCLRSKFNTGKNHIITVTGIGYKFET